MNIFTFNFLHHEHIELFTAKTDEQWKLREIHEL